MSDVHDYLRLGVDLANQHTDLHEMFAKWPRDRTVVLRICRPHPEVENVFTNWLTLYAEDKLREGAVAEEPLSLYLDTGSEQYALVLKKGEISNPTVAVFITELMFWDIAGRTNTIYTAFITGKPIVVRSTERYDLRDLAHMDAILSVIHEALLKKNINLASLVG